MKNIFLFVCLLFFISLPPIFAENLPVKIKQGMPYLKARNILIESGWQTVTMHTTANGFPICWSENENDSRKSCEYEEIDSCSGTGMGFCKMWFFDGEDKYLKIITREGEPPDAVIDFWKKTKKRPSED